MTHVCEQAEHHCGPIVQWWRLAIKEDFDFYTIMADVRDTLNDLPLHGQLLDSLWFQCRRQRLIPVFTEVPRALSTTSATVDSKLDSARIRRDDILFDSGGGVKG